MAPRNRTESLELRNRKSFWRLLPDACLALILTFYLLSELIACWNATWNVIKCSKGHVTAHVNDACPTSSVVSCPAGNFTESPATSLFICKRDLGTPAIWGPRPKNASDVRTPTGPISLAVQGSRQRLGTPVPLTAIDDRERAAL